MKVTICFGNTRIVVPCGNGDISVSDLQQKACIRYRRAIGKDADYAVKILKLESSNDGGILDIEDMVNDVVEDKDKLIAIYEEEDPSHGDWEQGSAASSEGKNTSSHMNPHLSHSSSEFDQRYFSVAKHDSPNHYIKKKTSFETQSGFDRTETDSRTLLPREKLSPISFQTNSIHSTTVGQNGISRPNGYDSVALNNGDVRQRMRSPISDEKRNINGILKKRTKSKDNPYFQSDDVTLQPSIGGSELPSIAVTEDVHATSPDNSINFTNTHLINEHTSLHPLTSWLQENSRDVYFVNDGTVEAISVREHFDPQSHLFVGLLVQAISQKPPIKNDCRLSSGDVIIGINDHFLMNYGFNDAEALLTQSLAYSDVFFRVLSTQNGRKSRGPYSFQETLTSLIAPEEPSSIPTMSPTSADNSLSGKRISSESANSSHNSSYPKSLSLRGSSNQLTKKSSSNQITIQMLKDNQGLGFSLTSNDAVAGDLPGPLYVQEILKDGAAMKNGKLLVGDKLLEINGISVLGKTQQDVVNQLRSLQVGSVVSVTVSRHVENLPRKLKQDPNGNHVIQKDHLKEYFTYDVALNDTGSAGLGIGLKGNQNTMTGQDLGVFVRSVFHGGAAWQDGRLKANDQLIEVNGHSLRGISNQAAIGILRTSMSTEGNVRGMIQLTIARRKVAHEISRISSDGSSEMSEFFPENQRTLSRSDSFPSSLVKQSSLPSLLLETSFGPNDMDDVISQGFDSFTLGRIRKRDNNKLSADVAHNRSHSSTAETDGIDAEAVSRVHQKIFSSSSSSSSLIGSLLSSSNSHGCSRAPPGDSYATWTIPRTKRIPKRTLSIGNATASTAESLASALEEEEELEESQRSAFDEITAGELGSEVQADPLVQVNKELRNKKHVRVNSYNGNSKEKNADESARRVEQNLTPPEKNVQPSLPPTVKMREHRSKSPALQSNIRRSISTESMVLDVDELADQLQSKKKATQSSDMPEVGPCLGIAKSSSLESLQTAVESCMAEQNADPSVARSVPKTVRGRVLNDSFRAALNRTYELAESVPLKQMDTPQTNDVPEDYAPIIKSSGDSASKSNKKKNRFFGLFKTSKPKKLEIGNSPNLKLSEKDEHKRNLEARREKDFEKMKEENERIQSKAREMREKQAAARKKENGSLTDKKSNVLPNERSPSVPVTSMNPRLEEYYLKENPSLPGQTTLNSSNRQGRKEVLFPVDESKESKKSKKRSKSENRKFKEASAAYNSLPRQPRRKSNEPWDNDSVASSDPSSVHRVDNFSYYNQNKPNRAEAVHRDMPRVLHNRSNTDRLRPTSPENRAKSPLSVLPDGPGTNHVSKPSRSNEKNHKPQLQGSNYMRKKSSNAKQKPVRHSIYTEQPSAFSSFASPRALTSPIPQDADSVSGQLKSSGSMASSRGRVELDSASFVEGSQTSPSSGLEVIERNQKPYFRVKQLPKMDGASDKIEMSVPCNL